MQTLEQRRAAHALAQIKAIPPKDHAKYKSYVQALPAAILMNGLGQALATELAAAGNDREDPHRLLAKHVADWLLGEAAHSPYARTAEPRQGSAEPARTLLQRMVEGEQEAYVRAQAEAIAYVTWLKKFANAFLDTSGIE